MRTYTCVWFLYVFSKVRTKTFYDLPSLCLVLLARRRARRCSGNACQINLSSARRRGAWRVCYPRKGRARTTYLSSPCTKSNFILFPRGADFIIIIFFVFFLVIIIPPGSWQYVWKSISLRAYGESGRHRLNEKSLEVCTTTGEGGRTVFNFTFTIEIVFRAAGHFST